MILISVILHHKHLSVIKLHILIKTYHHGDWLIKCKYRENESEIKDIYDKLIHRIQKKERKRKNFVFLHRLAKKL